MRNTRTFILLLIIALVGSLTAPSQLIPAGVVHAQEGKTSISAEPVTDKELIRNGQFDDYGAQYYEPNGWERWPAGLAGGVEPTGGQDGGPVMKMEGITEPTVALYQQLRLPSETTAATMDVQFRMFPTSGGSAQFGAYVVAVTDSQGTLQTLATAALTPAVNADTGWQPVSYTLTPAEVAQVQAAHSAGQPVYAYFLMGQDQANAFATLVDNVSFKVSGSTTLPTSAGSIAFTGTDAAGNPKTVNRIDPDGTNRQTVWTHPSTVPETNHIYDVAWKPDATELAFSSNHDSIHSAFNSDVYGVKPNGSGLRRITNPPSKAELDAGRYQFGTVTGKVHNNYKSVASFLLYIEGAKSSVSVSVGQFNDEMGFTVPDIADLGTGLHYVVFIWADGNGANCREYPPAVIDVQANATVDAGTLSFSGGECYTYDSDSISWKSDGSQLAVDVGPFRKFKATGEVIGTELFSAREFASEVAWSPVDDQILYHSWTTDTPTNGVYLTTVGGGTGTHLVQTGSALGVTPAWLHDGSGFVYTTDSEVRQYILKSKTDTLLASFGGEYVFNPSVSPDDKYIVFEWQTSGVPRKSDLWIMDRANPVQLWELTTDGHSSDPDWSRKDPTTTTTCTRLTGVTIAGTGLGSTGVDYSVTANVDPGNASVPTYTWSPTPASGQSTNRAVYRWANTGSKQIKVDVSNCSGTAEATGNHTVTIGSVPTQKTFLPIVIR